MLERILLFLFAVGAAGFIVAAAIVLPSDRRASVLYLIGAVFLMGLAWRSWKRLVALIRAGRGAEPRAPDA